LKTWRCAGQDIFHASGVVIGGWAALQYEQDSLKQIYGRVYYWIVGGRE
jgi:hypothetical protein